MVHNILEIKENYLCGCYNLFYHIKEKIINNIKKSYWNGDELIEWELTLHLKNVLNSRRININQSSFLA